MRLEVFRQIFEKTPFPKEDHLAHWARWKNQVKNGDRVFTTSFNIILPSVPSSAKESLTFNPSTKTPKRPVILLHSCRSVFHSDCNWRSHNLECCEYHQHNYISLFQRLPTAFPTHSADRTVNILWSIPNCGARLSPLCDSSTFLWRTKREMTHYYEDSSH